MNKRPRLFAGYFLEWTGTYEVGAIRDVSVDKYYIAYKYLTEICPDLTIDKLDEKAYQSILNEYTLTHERQTTMDFHHQIGSCVRDMYHEGLIKRDPTCKAIIKGIPPRPKKKKFSQKGKLQKLLKSLELGEGINIDWFILLIAKAGVRFAEAIALTPADFDRARNTVSINRILNYRNSTMFSQDTKNKSSVRTIGIDWQIVGQFKPLIENLPWDELIFVNRDEKTGKYKRIFNSTYNSHLVRKCKESGIAVITIHGLRHTRASILLADEVSTHNITKRLGHSSVATTQETYMHIIDELQSKNDEEVLGALMQLSQCGNFMYRKRTKDELVYLGCFVFENDTQLIEASKYLNRSINAIRKELCKMRKEDDFRRYMHCLWSEKEDEFLKKHYLSMKNRYIVDKLSRAVGAVKFGTKRLGLTKHKKVEELDTEIRRLIDKDYYLNQICTELNTKTSPLIAHYQHKKIPYRRVSGTEYKNYGKHVWNMQGKVRLQGYLSKQELKASEEDDSRV